MKQKTKTNTTNLTDIIRIVDWYGNELFQGNYQNPRVDEVLSANKCKCGDGSDECKDCNGSGYSGDFTIGWLVDQDRNIYEFINY